MLAGNRRAVKGNKMTSTVVTTTSLEVLGALNDVEQKNAPPSFSWPATQRYFSADPAFLWSVREKQQLKA
jgi:hypothetical protein